MIVPICIYQTKNSAKHKPITVAAHFSDAHTAAEKVVYALGQIGEGTADKVQQFLLTLTDERSRSIKFCSNYSGKPG
jgi:hypothetical protein